MAVILDAGALVAVDRRDQIVQAVLSGVRSRRAPVRIGAGVVAQVWRRGERQANLARVLEAAHVVPLDQDAARRIGELLAVTGPSDVVDAHCALLAREGDVVLTSDPADITRLLFARGVRAQVHRI